ncbi:HipA domain-containing protein [Pseudoxanthomonas sp. UTMC 1351]|uniref:HipA domain-containing protein n=1 Tax=Pseudoxanthomonas sp. UTMC 1351 TaxID=2695853 RepID=UPI0034CFF25E
MNAGLPPRRLEIWLEDRRIGELREQGNLWALAYDTAWRQDGYDLSPSLPRAEGEVVDGASVRPVQWFFDNLLPEEGARQLVAHDAGVDAADAFGLLQRFGPESAGALTLLAPGQTLLPPDLRLLPDEVLSARIRALPRLPLSHDAPKRMSLAGAQHKLAVVIHEGRLWEPVGRAASTHLLKPDHERVDDYPHSVANEWFCMRLAAACGLPVPAVEVRRLPEPIYLARRFDREGDGSAARRLYALDACQLLSLDRTFKYSQATIERLRQLVILCRRPAATRIALLRWQIFNLLIGNGDAHLKNLSFLVSADGLELAPHYDLLSTAVYRAPDWGAAESVISMGGKRRFGDIGRAEVLAFGQTLGVPEQTTARHLDRLCVDMPQKAIELMDEYEQGAAGRVDPGEARLLRQIVHGPLEDRLRVLRVVQ